MRGDPPTIDGNAVLFSGPPFPLDTGRQLPDVFLDSAYRRELARRSELGGPFIPDFSKDLVLRKADYAIDLGATNYLIHLDSMFAEFDKDRNGVVTADEYTDPVKRSAAGPSGGAVLSR